MQNVSNPASLVFDNLIRRYYWKPGRLFVAVRILSYALYSVTYTKTLYKRHNSHGA